LQLKAGLIARALSKIKRVQGLRPCPPEANFLP
jgi:hypothetical protein